MTPVSTWIRRTYVVAVAILFITHTLRSSAAQPAEDALPEPLTLEYALSLADDLHPELRLARARLDAAKAERLSADSRNDLESGVRARVRWIDPSSGAMDQSNDDHSLSLYVDKTLYDFGRSRALIEAADAGVKSRELLLLEERYQRRIDIMAAFFDVLLADLAFLRDNEDMSVEFVRLDRLRDRKHLGQVSDIEVLEQESRYQEIRSQRYASEARQRTTRALLAQALNRPGQLPSVLDIPRLKVLERPLPEVEGLQQRASRENPLLLALQEQHRAVQQKIEAARAGDNPVLKGEMEASTYTRNLGSRDDLRIGVTLEVPLTRGGRMRAEVAGRRAELHELEAEIARTRMAINQSILETRLNLRTLRARHDEARALYAYRELYLDRSRALYEMEVKTDLGDSMVRISDVQLQLAAAEYRIALAWARLDALTGNTEFLALGSGQRATADDRRDDQPGVIPKPQARE